MDVHINRVHCLFEQSGTFKNEFIKLGIPAEDYDIQNNFGETDNVIDIFAEIEKAFKGVTSIFDKIRGGQDGDLIMAFFPCIYFCQNNMMLFSWCSQSSRREESEWYSRIQCRGKPICQIILLKIRQLQTITECYVEIILKSLQGFGL